MKDRESRLHFWFDRVRTENKEKVTKWDWLIMDKLLVLGRIYKVVLRWNINEEKKKKGLEFQLGRFLWKARVKIKY